jgi:hypothetical protein
MAEQALWTTLMNNVIKLHGDSQKKKWKVASPNESLCAVCEEKGGVLIRCSHEKCSQFFHLDCALNQGGLTLLDNGLLLCECENHHKELLFCTCKEKYDPTKAMIFCSGCCDWYHFNCEHISTDMQNQENYFCRSCSDLKAQGKSVSKTVQERNKEKDYLSVCNQAALRFIGVLHDLAITVGPIIDSLTIKSEDSDMILDISELYNALDYLNSPPFASNPNTLDKSDEEETLILLGFPSFLNSWIEKCHEMKDKCNKWLEKVASLSDEICQTLDHTLSQTHIQLVQEFFERFKKLELEKFSNISIFDAFICFGDCLKWILDFYQVLHNSLYNDFLFFPHV